MFLKLLWLLLLKYWKRFLYIALIFDGCESHESLSLGSKQSWGNGPSLHFHEDDSEKLYVSTLIINDTVYYWKIINLHIDLKNDLFFG